MNLTPELSIVASFIGFSWIFVKKIYPYITKTLDKHIESVENKIHEAELLKDEASLAIKKACENKCNVKDIIEEANQVSSKKIERLKEEHELYLKSLQEKYEALLKSQLEAELAKQKDLLIKKLSDLVIQKLSEKINDKDCKILTEVTKEDLSKLM